MTSAGHDDSDVAFRLFAGVGLGRHVAFELGYVDFGEASFRGQSDGSGLLWNAGPVAERVAADGYELAVVGKLPLTEDWALFARVGRLRWDVSQRMAGDTQCCGPVDETASGDGYDTTFGGGAQFEGFRPVRLALEYGVASFAVPVRYADTKEADVAVLRLSLAYLF